MAYMNQQKKAKIVAAVKPVLQKYGLKGTFSVRNHMTICLNIKSGPIDFIENYIETDKQKPYAKYMSEDQINYIRKNKALDINPYWFQEHFSGIAKRAIKEIIDGMYSADYYDRSDAQTDYFDTAYYIDVNIGSWNKPYQLTK
jgi:hypothetical protein